MGQYDFAYPEPDESPPAFPQEEKTLAHMLGETVLWFEELDDQLSTAISFLLRRGDQVGRIVTCELSFRAKLNLFEALFRNERPDSKNLDDLRELCRSCSQIEEKRNQVIHSNWRSVINGPGVTRLKYTARGKHGLREHSENFSLNQVEAIWCHCGYLARSVDELMFLEFDIEYGTLEDPYEPGSTAELDYGMCD
jgi:hypothetical protein